MTGAPRTNPTEESNVSSIEDRPMSEWMRAHLRNEQRIREHPDFHRLVREVAIAEQPTGTPWRLRNSLTYAAWRTRGDDGHGRPYRAPFRRAQLFAEKIATELGILPDSPAGDRAARVYVTARDNVRARLR